MSTDNTINLTEFLSQQYLCESLTLREVQTLLEFTELVTFKKNAIIADIGEVGEALYFMLKGEVALIYEADGQSVEIGGIKEGELVGEMSFFDREPRSVRLLAKSADTRLLRLSRSRYQRLRVEHPFIAVNLLEHAIINLDHLFRRVSQDVATFSRYVYGGKK
jgi:cAMP-binding proteins - catabolite gene activator and regulatory subunit of cAMP-dependent protein kinases